MNPIAQQINSFADQFLSAGDTDYIGEAISQREHSLQCAYFAEQAGHSEEVILASLLHDMGHFFSGFEQFKMADLGVVHHEWIGAKLAYDFHFSAKVALLIGYHVDAKRYFAAKKGAYYQRLSSASQQTLAYQGGPMRQDELLAFEMLPIFKEILQVRVSDERAKEVDLIVPSFDYYQPMIQQHIRRNLNRVNTSNPLKAFVDAQWVEELKKFLLSQLESGKK